MNARKQKISDRLVVVQKRLQALEDKEPKPYERAIVEVGIMALKEEVRNLGRQMERA